ncbi:MAG: hypothetical protein CO093_09235 [Alphaproteobacteria bacterium CG_4_9_14_3_um_filter_47_13]|nr:MAG: hypothetical protein CO093_09235 [Alphaproteobacteria bacterium CG_4_9_14_3_um_filter_47_13]
MKTSAIIAASENNCIGLENDLPWHIPQDLKRFKSLTMGKPVIMGRKTFESIVARLGKPLPGRDNLVISRSGFEAGGALVCPDIESAVAKAKNLAEEKGLDEVFIIGGAQIYELAIPFLDHFYLTRVHIVVNGDAFLPALNEQDWREIERDDIDGTPSFSFITLERVSASRQVAP